jgi:hypothetical protein
MRATPRLPFAALLLLAFAAVACGSDEPDIESSGAPSTADAAEPSSTSSPDAEADPASAPDDEARGPGYLTSVCPDPIKVQLQWYPQPDPYAAVFGLIDGGELDGDAASYTGPMHADPDQTLEIIGGGPLAGYQSTTSLMYADSEILLGDMNMDESISNSASFPTVGVLGPFVTSPLALLYNPEVHDFSSMDDVREAGTTVLVTQSATFASAMIGLGILDESQVDFSFDFGPARFVDSNGDIAQQSFVTHDPYEYLNSEFWGRPVASVLLADSYPSYQNVLTVTPENLEAEADCLERLVPLVQQSMVDYVADPVPMHELMVELSDGLGNPAAFTMESLEFTYDSMLSNGLVGNTGVTSTFGSFDMDRVAEVIEILDPVFDGDESFDPAVTGDQVATNNFIDPTIGLDE